MACYAYILWSPSLKRHYAGIAEDVHDRLRRHRHGETRATSGAADWEIVWSTEAPDYAAAREVEKRIKARGASRFLADEGWS